MSERYASRPGHGSDRFQQIMEYTQSSVLILLGIMIVLSAGITLMSAFGVIPWLEIAATLGGHPIPGLGPMVQILFTVFCASLLAFLPASTRILKLEKAHREFTLNLEDIERAYRAAHAEDRTGVFTLGDEFAAVRERLAFMRKHPDLAHMEPEVLETAAQMSYLSRDLALVYSDDAVARAKMFLTQRQEELDRHNNQMAKASKSAQDLRRWLTNVEGNELKAKAQITQLQIELQALLDQIEGVKDRKIVSMPNPRGAQRREM